MHNYTRVNAEGNLICGNTFFFVKKMAFLETAGSEQTSLAIMLW